MSVFTPEPFRPHPLLSNAHLQTIIPNYMRGAGGITYRRVRLDTPDNDFIDVDIASVEGYNLPDDAPVMIGLHGLEGSARGGYLTEMYRLLAQQGIRGVGMNYRSCSGEMNRTAKLYHLGATDDVTLVHDWVDREFPGTKKVLAGFSLGANLLLKYLGEKGKSLDGRIQAAVSVSPPFGIGKPQRISHEGGIIKIYRDRILTTLRGKVNQKAELTRAAGGDVAAAMAAQTLDEFDNAIIAPLHGFKSAQDYYDRTASAQFLPGIAVPTLIMRALDDPFFYQDVPYDVLRQNPYLTAAITEHGGHVGFMTGLPPFTQRHHAQIEAVRFFAAMLKSQHS